ncbi:acyl-CoA dehydrogenase family protein [Paraburkholderia pallida]|nr:acyl-CoA dehydrogenase family protein [Paraburkholderia pallida]
MSNISLSIDAEQVMVADAVRRLCKDRMTFADGPLDGYSPGLWRELASLGVLSLAGADGGDDALLTLVVAAEEIGRTGFPGPFAATVAAMRVLPAEVAHGVAEGERVVSMGVAPLMPWGMKADVFVGLAGGRATLLSISACDSVETLGGEHWARVTSTEQTDLGPFSEARWWYDIVIGAQLVGAGLGLIDTAASHANTRRQFGQLIGAFQGVAFPLAQAVVALESAQMLIRSAAVHVQHRRAGFERLCLSARLSASRAARQAAFATHQVFGAAGAVADGPVFWQSRRIQQWSVQAPSDRDAWHDVSDRDFSTGASALLIESGTAEVLCSWN